MHNVLPRRAALLVGVGILALSLSGCNLPGATTSAATATLTPRPLSVTGTWVFTDPNTVEKLYLKQGKGGTISGHGDAAVKGTDGKLDHSSIAVQKGSVTKGKVNLQIYITPIDWGSGATLVEYLHCTTAARVLHCRMDAPLFANVRNVPQDFHRRA